METTATSIERNIIKEIMKECLMKKINVNENFVIYFVKLLLLDPNWGITADFVSSRENVHNFIHHVIGELEAQHFPKIVTLQIQFYFTCSMENVKTIIKKTRRDLIERLSRLQNDIIKTTELDCPEEVSKFTRKIICYITLLSGLGNPQHEEVYTEALKAFSSVMNETEILEFVKSSKDTKEEQLRQLAKVVSGIRLFNKDCQKGGYGIEDLPYLLTKATRCYTQDIQEALLKVMDKVNLLTTIVDTVYAIQETEEGCKMVCKLPPDIADVYMENIIDLLILYRQYELFARKLMEDAQQITTRSQTVYDNYEEMLKKVHAAVYMRIAVPAHIVFPLFEELANTWADMQDQVIMLAKYSKILVNLEMYSKCTYYNSEMFESMLEESGAHTDAERLEETACLNILSDNVNVRVFSADDFQDIDKIQLQHLGFCGWKLVETNGGLVPGNPSMGVANFQNMYYVFSTPEASREFSKRPEEYVMRVLQLARKKPQLINLLFLKEQLQQVIDVGQLTEEKVVKMSKDKEVQLEDFNEIMPTNIDKTYKWNIWDLKREAIMLANLSKCKTVSTQTWKTPSRNTIKNQTYDKKEQIVQTKKDNYSNVPKPSNFIYGLRGRKDDEQFIINLTRPVKE